MAIATLLFSTLCLKVTGDTGVHGMKGAIAIGSVICIIAAMAGDTSQDLKTGYILGATPKKQQIGELIGVIVSAAAIGGVLYDKSGFKVLRRISGDCCDYTDDTADSDCSDHTFCTCCTCCF